MYKYNVMFSIKLLLLFFPKSFHYWSFPCSKLLLVAEPNSTLELLYITGRARHSHSFEGENNHLGTNNEDNTWIYKFPNIMEYSVESWKQLPKDLR